MSFISNCTRLMLFISSFMLMSCLKTDPPFAIKKASDFKADLVSKWLNMQLNLLRVPLEAGAGTQASERAQAYCGIALYEAILGGMHGYRSLQGQLSMFPPVPAADKSKLYNWAIVANASLAESNRKLFPAASPANKARIDSLEAAIYSEYSKRADDETLSRSVQLGREVSDAVYAWAATDGSANINPPFVPSGAPGTWVSTPPNFPAAVNPYASQRRRLVVTSDNKTDPQPPPAYSAKPGSPFYEMVKEVYNISLLLTPEQKAMAIYHRDLPGYPGGGQFVAVLSQVLTKANTNLGVAALAYVKTGIIQHEATVICFTYKYSFNVVRPITYIRNELGHPDWTALFNTPGHPEFPAAHAVNSAAVAGALTSVFGENFQFTLNSYDYLGLPARNYTSFKAMAKEMADSRVFGGIHYQASCDKGRAMGYQISANVLASVRFK